MALDTKARDRLAKFLGMMSSDYDGEVLIAARMANKLIAEAGTTWAEVLLPQPIFATMDMATPFGDRSVYTAARSSENHATTSRWWVQRCKNLIEMYRSDMTAFDFQFLHALIRRGKDLTPDQCDRLSEITLRYIK